MTSTAHTVTLTLDDADTELVVHALRALLSDFGHDENDVLVRIREVLARVEAARATPSSTN